MPHQRMGLIGGIGWPSTQDYYVRLNQAVARRIGGLASADLAIRSLDFEQVLLAAETPGAVERLFGAAAGDLQAAGAKVLGVCANTGAIYCAGLRNLDGMTFVASCHPPKSSCRAVAERARAQSRMPIAADRRGTDLAGHGHRRAVARGPGQQQLEPGVPLGETLVRMGVVSQGQLQTALVRKMGYPLVNLHVFPAAADALRKISHGVARRLQVMPLMLHEGRLIVALDDPTSRHSALDEVEFIAQMKVVPVVGQCLDLDGVLNAAYEKIGEPAVGAAGGFAANLDPSRPLEFDMAGTSELLQTLEREGPGAAAAAEAPIEQSDNSLVRMINSMIIEAHREGASDIHIESYPGQEKPASGFAATACSTPTWSCRRATATRSSRA
jgi:hypothetical protein